MAVSHAALLVPVQVPPAGALVTPTLPDPADAPTFAVGGDNVNVAVAGAWVTVCVAAPTLMVPVRLASVLFASKL